MADRYDHLRGKPRKRLVYGRHKRVVDGRRCHIEMRKDDIVITEHWRRDPIVMKIDDVIRLALKQLDERCVDIPGA